MPDVVLFTPKSELDAVENLRGFVDLCRDQLAVFGNDLPFDENVWDLSSAIKLKARGSKRFRVPFSTLLTANRKTVDFMPEPFLTFAKSYFRYSFAMRPTKSPGRRIMALRALGHALNEHGEFPSPTRATTDSFNRAAALVKERFSAASGYRVGGELELLAKFMSENRIVVVPIDWRNPLKRPSSASRVGNEFDELRRSKLPSVAALDALPKLFNLATEPLDVLVTSVAAILCSAPDRINEVLLLPVDCEIYQSKKDGACTYGLRWWPAKGADPMVKWIVPSMAEVVQGAVAKIKKLTAEARVVATWYKENPTKLYLPKEAVFLRNQEFLSTQEVGMVLYSVGHARCTPLAWCKLNNVPITKNGKHSVIRFADLEKALIAKLPRNFPVLDGEVGLDFSDALFVFRKNELHAKKSVFNGLVESVTIDQINDALGGRAEFGLASVFQRYGFSEPDGSHIKVPSHQFRHYLNTLAQAGGMSQLDIAKWSGRKDIHQNTAYDHVSADELVLKIRNALGDDRQMFGPLAELPKRVVISRDEFARLKVPTAHTTEFGVCIHDYTMAPCQLHADCLNCNEQVCIKGDETRAARLRAELGVAIESLEAARLAQGEEAFGANRWVEHHQLTVERLGQLCAILDDPQVPVGAIIQLSNLPVVSRIEQAVETRADKQAEPLPLASSIDAMRNLLAGMEDIDA